MNVAACLGEKTVMIRPSPAPETKLDIKRVSRRRKRGGGAIKNKDASLYMPFAVLLTLHARQVLLTRILLQWKTQKSLTQIMHRERPVGKENLPSVPHLV